MALKVIICVRLFTQQTIIMSNDQSFLDNLTRDLGIGTSVQVRHLPKHAQQECDVIYGPPTPLSGILPVVSRSYKPLKLQELCSALIVANISPHDLQT
jgi:hypothetical protein